MSNIDIKSVNTIRVLSADGTRLPSKYYESSDVLNF